MIYSAAIKVDCWIFSFSIDSYDISMRIQCILFLFWELIICSSLYNSLFSLLDAVMQEEVILPAEDDVTVLNKPVQTKYYEPPASHDHPARDYDF